ncbi:cell cycle checkpoint protein RAD1 [Episyrphus balteatus]|uniref:cell cycle checkpoint protein RAD1 n=1 Tax=Episyrphus balteatus TaxID=286459 RepID=UPI002484EC36|nr:cell cycle checkpoint protein RAD1 [Episyrphus balteatus]
MHNSKILYEKGILKNLKMLTQTQYSNFKFAGRLDKVKAFYAGMKAISFGETAKFQINENGFRIMTENAKSIQASLFITKEVFEEFFLDGEYNFSVNMNILVECIGLFAGSDCSMKMFYKGEGAPLIMVIEDHADEDVTTECSIKTSQFEESTEYSLNENSPNYNIIFIRGPDMSQIFSEIDKTADELEITLSPKVPHFRIATIGVMQSESNIEVAKTSDMMLMFNCRGDTVTRYKCSHIRLTSKALSACSKVALKTDSSGLLELHFMIYSSDEAQVYIQFFVLPMVEED